MGRILEFVLPESRKCRKTGELPKDGATVVIFPGIRIERAEIDLSARYGSPMTRTRADSEPAKRR